MKILIAYDGSSCADAAVNDLQRAGLPAVAEVRILSVAEVFLPQPSDDPSGSVEPLPAVVQRAHARQRLQREPDHGPVIDGHEVLVRDLGERVEPRARAPGEDDAFHDAASLPPSFGSMLPGGSAAGGDRPARRDRTASVTAMMAVAAMGISNGMA